MSLAESIANALGGAKKTAEGWLCKCPCHPDKTASLSVADHKTKENDVIVSCFADCNWEAIKRELITRKLLPEFKGNKNDKPIIIRCHKYTDANGNYLFEKIKRSDGKTFSRIVKNGREIWSVKEIEDKPLYNLPGLLRGIQAGEPIYITEGEKDADYLINKGLCATTSFASSFWSEKYTEILKNASSIVIFPDNDVPGEKIAKKRHKIISAVVANTKTVKLPTEINGKHVKDVADFFDAGGTVVELNKLIEQTETGEASTEKRKNATRQDYIKEIRSFFGDVRRCIFSDDLCYLDQHSKLWSPVANKIKALRSEIKEKTRTGTLNFRPADVEDHLYSLENSATPRFVIDVPEWDGRDRIKELADRVILKPIVEEKQINNKCFEDLLKFWHAKMWTRLYSPEVRNEIFILAGPQNIGKDFWIRENCEALGQYLINFSIHSNERDTKEQLHRGLVMNISEFDRTSRSEVSLLKEIVTATQTDLRFAYDRRAMTRACRCSFIASTNVNDIFNDPTGHSRYVFFELQDIKKDKRFSANDKLQVLAQGQALASQNYKPDDFSLAAMYDQIQEHTPDDEYELIVERWDYLCTEKFNQMSAIDKDSFGTSSSDLGFSGFFPNNITFDIIMTISKEFSKSPKKIRSTLKNNFRQRVHKEYGRCFYFKMVISNYPQQNYVF